MFRATRGGSVRSRLCPSCSGGPQLRGLMRDRHREARHTGRWGGLLAYSSVREKGAADFLLPFNWLMLSACLSLPDTMAVTFQQLCRQHTATSKLTTRERTSVPPPVLFPLVFFLKSDTFGEFHLVKLGIWVTSVSVSERRSKAEHGGLYLSLMLQVSNFSSL